MSIENGEDTTPDESRFKFVPGPETLKLMALNLALATKNDKLIHTRQELLDKVVIVPNSKRDNLEEDEMTTDQFISYFQLPDKYKERR